MINKPVKHQRYAFWGDRNGSYWDIAKLIMNTNLSIL